jgi:GNAT superfamily N-acetyltransferase
MAFHLRAAKHSDVELIAPWTVNTFAWGDYVGERLPIWIDDPLSYAMVCVLENDTPVAISHAVMLSDTEGWLEGARVHPDHQRSGLGRAMNNAGVAWCRERGAQVVRLAVERANTAAAQQVLSLGYRNTSTWLYTRFDVDHPTTRPSESFRLRAANRADVDAAWMAWSASELAHASRGMIARGWQWRKARPQDLRDAVTTGAFYQCPTGWIIANQEDHDFIRATWIATTAEDAPGMLNGLIDLAAESGATEVAAMLPDIPWIREAAIRAGGNPMEELVFSLSI